MMPVNRWAVVRLVALTILAPPLVAQAQAGKVARVGFLSLAPPGPATAAFRDRLRELGYIENQNLIFELRSAQGRVERLPQLATELVGLRLDVIVAGGLPDALALKQATTIIPIVTGAPGEPVECGLVASLARPGGNITGMAWIGSELIGKALELLKEILPDVSRVGMLWNPDLCSDRHMFRELQASARARGVKLQSLEVRTPEDVGRALKALQGAEALIATGGSPNIGRRRILAELAIQQRLPLVSTHRYFADDGALASYGPNLPAMFRRSATYVDRILKGAKPGDLPVEQPTRFELVVNLKTAKALKLIIPPSVLARADDVIQ